MADPTFDGTAKIITLNTGQTTVDVIDLYSAWKRWVGAGNAWAPQAFAPVGGDPIDASAGTAIPLYAFLINGWRVRPQEASHTLNVTGGVLLVQGGGDPFLNTLGSFVVRINYQQPVQAITLATGSGGGVTAAEVWQHVIEAGFSAEELLRLMAAMIQGSATGLRGAPASTVFKSIAGDRDRVVATVDPASGARTVTARDAS